MRSPPRERRVLAKQEPADARLDGDRQEALLLDHARCVHVSPTARAAGRGLCTTRRCIVARLKTHPHVREAAVVAFPDRRAGTGLYAFVEGDSVLTSPDLREFLATDGKAPQLPEHLQVTDELPRTASGEVRSEILELIAMNQVD